MKIDVVQTCSQVLELVDMLAAFEREHRVPSLAVRGSLNDSVV
jgi:hypothetical protein